MAATKKTQETFVLDMKKVSEDAVQHFEEAGARIKEFNVSMVENSKAVNRLALDNYENAVKNFFGLQRQLAGVSQTAWLKDTANTQIQFGEQVTTAWVSAARDLVK